MWLGLMSPWRLRIRQMVVTEGTCSTRLARWVGDALGSGVVAGRGQLPAEAQDGGLNFGPALVGAGVGPPGKRLQRRIATFAEPAE